MVVMESINVQVDDYIPPIDSPKPKEPPMGSLHEEGNILNIPKNAPPSSDRGRGTEDVQNTNDTQQHQNDQDIVERADIIAREPS